MPFPVLTIATYPPDQLKTPPSAGESFFLLRYTQNKEILAMNMIINIGAFVILAVLWLGFAAALIFDQSILDAVWQSFRGLPWMVQGVIWLLVLPVTAGL